MPLVNVFTVHINGDAGGAGISRYHVKNGAGGMLSAADANSAAGAVWDLWQGVKALLAQDVTYTIDPVFQFLDEASGAIQGVGTIGTVPAPTTGTQLTAYAGGNGARLYWHTSTVKGRRLVRGATFITPMSAGQYTANGQLAASTCTTVVAAGMSYVNACTSAALQAVVYCRPKKGTFTGGMSAPIVAATCPTTVASIRSRRS